MSVRCHPGGESLTRRVIELAGWGARDIVLDAGCGEGGTLLLLQRLCSPDCAGIDPDPPHTVRGATKGDACALPFEEGTFDGVLFECSLSLVRDPDAAVREAYRVLKAGGRLALANMTARAEAMENAGALGRLEKWETQQDRLTEAGFMKQAEEDHTDALLSLFGDLLLNGEPAPDPLPLRRARPGYMVSVWQK